MRKYYTMKECFDACGDDDVPFICGGFNHESFLTKKELLGKAEFTYPMPSIRQSMSARWQIKRAAPKVLSAEEAWKNNVNLGGYQTERVAFINGFEAGDKNGQLREWLRLKPLIDAATIAYNALIGIEGRYGEAIEQARLDLKCALNNLKPPYEI